MTNVVKTTILSDYIVGDTHYMVKVFPYPQSNEIDFEVFTPEGDYLFTISSIRPDLSTSVLWRYIKFNDRIYINYSSEDN